MADFRGCGLVVVGGSDDVPPSAAEPQQIPFWATMPAYKLSIDSPPLLAAITSLSSIFGQIIVFRKENSIKTTKQSKVESKNELGIGRKQLRPFRH